MIIRGCGKDNLQYEWDSWQDYLTDPNGKSNGLWASLGSHYIHDPQPPNAPVIKLDTLYRDSAGFVVDGTDWIPDPRQDSLIDLVFSFTDTSEVQTSQAIYEIFDISTWQGYNLNSPHGDPTPYAKGDSTFFDFHIVNPMYEFGPKYSIQTIDEDYYLEGGLGWGGGAPTNSATISVRRYTVVRNALVMRDTLWMEAQDYAAHAIVLPHTSCPYNLRLREHKWPYDTTKYIWSVSAPRDNDGFHTGYINRGDYMADAWEESVFDSARYNPVILDFYPFNNRGLDGSFRMNLVADDDSLPRGRNIAGDQLDNWEEYRGLTFLGSLDSGFYDSPKPSRLDPKTKDVFVSWNINASDPGDTAVTNRIPGYINTLPDATGSFYPAIHWVETYLENNVSAFNSAKYVISNEKGASYAYFSFPSVTNTPSIGTNGGVITWWAKTTFQHAPEYSMSQRFGSTYSLQSNYDYPSDIPNNPWFVPASVLGIVVYDHHIDTWSDSTYYAGKKSLWPGARDRMLKDVMAHEFGHTVGMPHYEDNHIMMKFTDIQDDTTQPNFGKFFPSSNYSSTYSDSNRVRFTIRFK